MQENNVMYVQKDLKIKKIQMVKKYVKKSNLLVKSIYPINKMTVSGTVLLISNQQNV
jgi:hypothetical protein